MKRSPALVLAAAFALALAGCGAEPGASTLESPAPGGSLHLEIIEPSDANGGPRAMPTSAVPPPTPTPPTPLPESGAWVPTIAVPMPYPSGPGAAAVTGQWGGAAEGPPVLWFSSGGHFNGNDGCNSLAGSWVVDGARIELNDEIMTLVACLGMDTWLSSAAVVQVKGDTLHVTNADGQEIGTLPRLNVAH